jgi:hypothetical protein
MSFILGILVIVGGLTAIGVLGSLGNAMAARIKAAPSDSARLHELIRELELRVAEAESQLAVLSSDSDRVLELEERVEFTERLLQQLRSREHLPPGQGERDA